HRALRARLDNPHHAVAARIGSPSDTNICNRARNDPSRDSDGAVSQSRYHDSMRFRCLLFALLLAIHADPQEIKFFLQMSDPQFGMYSANKDYAQETVNFEFAIATANRLRPKF